MYVEAFNQIDLDADFSILYAGEQECPPGHAYGGIRDHWLLHLVLEGRGWVRLAGASHQLGPGGFFMFPPGQAHQYAASRQQPWHYIWFGCTGRRAAMYLAESGCLPERPVGTLPEWRGLETAIRNLIATFLGKGLPPAEARNHSFRVLDELQRAARQAGLLPGATPLPSLQAGPATGTPATMLDTPDDPAAAGALQHVRKLLLFFDTNYHRPIGIKQAADWVHLDRTYCARIFRQHTGTSMQDYLTATRMQKARLLLLNSDLPVKAVASSVGFTDYATFAKRFQAENGIAPGEFRKTPRSSEPRGKPR